MYLNNNIYLENKDKEELQELCKNVYKTDKWNCGSLEVHMVKPLICNDIKITNNEEFLSFINNSERKEHRILYTDGSKTTHDVKAAFYDSTLKIGRYFRLHNNTSIFTAEAYAIYEVLKYIKKMLPKKYLSVTDSLSVLKCLDNTTLSYKNNIYIYSAKEILKVLYDMGKIVEFLWVPSHSGITGNEIANSLMKGTFDIPVHENASIPFTDFYSAIKGRMYLTWNKYWEETRKVKGAWYANIQDVIPKMPWHQKLKNPSRKYITTMNRLRIGHGRFREHVTGLNSKTKMLVDILLTSISLFSK
ncbi:hypothetical protein evm_009777 [Chilo suppressalis]|nr:hypothetical protein evm_009777 [Chilo suppressalis]